MNFAEARLRSGGDYHSLPKGDWLSEPNRILQPWQNDPYRLFSWLEMLQFSANSFVRIGYALRHLKADALLASMVTPGDEPIFNMAAELDAESIAQATKWVEMVEEELRVIGITLSADTAAELLKELKRTDKVRRNCQWLSDQAQALWKLSGKEIMQHFFFYVPPERAKFFPRKDQPNPFGDEVAAAFPSARIDIQEAAVCMALSRSTAAVMHAVRALEPALLAVAREAGFTPKRDEWGSIIEGIEKRINPTDQLYIQDRAKREFLAPAAAQFRYFKDAWRNHAMHGRSIYLDADSEHVYGAVRSFMMYLAEEGIKE